MTKKEPVNERELNEINLQLIPFFKLQLLQFRPLPIIPTFHTTPF